LSKSVWFYLEIIEASLLYITLSKSVWFYLEIIEASLLYIQAKTFAGNHRCVFHFFEFDASNFLVKKIGLYGRKQAKDWVFSYKANIIIDQL